MKPFGSGASADDYQGPRSAFLDLPCQCPPLDDGLPDSGFATRLSRYRHYDEGDFRWTLSSISTRSPKHERACL